MLRLDLVRVGVISVLLAAVQAQTPSIAGCFNSSQPLTLVNTSGTNSAVSCNDVCRSKKKPVLGLHGDACWCGDELPPTNTNAGPRFCDTKCPGDSSYICGGTDGSNTYFTVWLTGIEATVPNLQSTSSSSTATSSTGTGSPTTAGTKTTTMNTKTTTASTGSPAAASSSAASQLGSGTKAKSSSHDGGDQDLAIALGVILGVAALVLMGVLFWWTGRRRRRTGTYGRYNRNSVDSSRTLQPDGTVTSSTAPGMSMKSPPDSETSGIGGPPYGGPYGPSIFVQQPTPAPPTLASQPSYENGLAPTGLLTPGSRYSRGSSEADPYYTPLEQPSNSHFNQAEQSSLRTESQRPSSSIGEDERADVLSPLETIGRPERKPSRDLVNGFDFAFEDERHNRNGRGTYDDMSPMPTMHMPGYFGTFYDDGR